MIIIDSWTLNMTLPARVILSLYRSREYHSTMFPISTNKVFSHCSTNLKISGYVRSDKYFLYYSLATVLLLISIEIVCSIVDNNLLEKVILI